MQIEEIRLTNLQNLIDSRFGGVKAKLAREIGKQSDYVSRWFSKGKQRRNINNNTAREIEQKLGLSNGWLDVAQGGISQPAPTKKTIVQYDKIKDFQKYAEELSNKQFKMFEKMASYFVALSEENQKGTLDFTKLLYDSEMKLNSIKRLRSRAKIIEAGKNESKESKTTKVTNISERRDN